MRGCHRKEFGWVHGDDHKPLQRHPKNAQADKKRGPRHALVISKTIKQTGMLAETEVIQGTIGIFNVRGMAKVTPLAIRMAYRGKLPPPFIKPIPKVDEVRTIFDALEVPVH